MSRSSVLLQPQVRGPVDATRAQAGDPQPPALEQDVVRLASDSMLDRIQADNRLRQAGPEGILAVAHYLARNDAKPPAMIEAMNFLMEAEIEPLEAPARADVRAMVAQTLSHKDGKVRAAAARVLQVHGPGSQRAAFLRAIGDSETRVRWAVVRRFGDFPQEVQKAQVLILLGYLAAGTPEEFARQDTNKDGFLSTSEFIRGVDDFSRLDADHDGKVSANEWSSPYDSAIRADVYALLLRMHEKLTPNLRPIVYNPYAPAAEQLDAVAAWQAWMEALPAD
ncbi:MAG: hypothetical protein IPP14_13715 [Planctomycetes bacterium]|nr:hypothetical protein [Planctomycetota bacterium]